MTSPITIYVDPKLKEAAGKAADKAELPLSELAARALAEYIGCPELGKVPRKSIGRPRKAVS